MVNVNVLKPITSAANSTPKTTVGLSTVSINPVKPCGPVGPVTDNPTGPVGP